MQIQTCYMMRHIGLCVLSWIIGSMAQRCDIVVSTISDKEEGAQIEFPAIFINDCSLTSTGDRIYWQKLIYDKWEDLFEYNGDNGENSAIDRDGDDYDLTGRSSGEYTNAVPVEHKLTVFPSKLCDGGTWRCRIITKGEQFFSNERSFNVQVTTQREDIVLLPPSNATLLAGYNESLECKITTISPEGFVTWWIDGNEDTSGSESGGRNGCGWNIHNKYNKNFVTIGDKSVKCILNQDLKTESYPVVYTVKGSPNIESGGIEISTPSPLANESYSVACIASGGDVQISWTFNEQEVDNKYFTRVPDKIIQPPDLPFGQTDALESVLHSVIYDEPTIDSVVNQAGTFVCKATVSAHTGNVTVESDGKTVELRYKPLINGSSEVNVQFETRAELLCNCVAPSDVKYSWNHLKNGIADEILDETARIFIATRTGNYSCKASNELGKVEIFFILDQKPPNAGQNVGAIVGGCIAAIIVICGCLGLAFYIYKKKAAQKDEEVAAYAESGNTNNGVCTAKSTTLAGNTTTAPAVYAEVNKDNKKPNTKEPTEPVYSQVNKPGRPLPQLQPKRGSTNTRPVYSEVSKSKQGRRTPIENKHYDNAGQRNEHGGLHYADVDFLDQGNGAKQSHDTKNPAYEPTEYAQIDHRKSAGIVV